MGDKSTPEDISSYFHGISKKDFKNAIGSLYREGLVAPGGLITSLVPDENRKVDCLCVCMCVCVCVCMYVCMHVCMIMIMTIDLLCYHSPYLFKFDSFLSLSLLPSLSHTLIFYEL